MMSAYTARFFWGTMLSLWACAGCAQSIPRISWEGPVQAMNIMSQRDRSIRSFSTTGRLRLLSKEGQIEFTTAIVAKPPSHLRMRAWKFSQAIFDITMNADGLFVWTKKGNASDGGNAATRSQVERLTHESLIQAASLLPGFCHYADWEFVNVDDRTLLIQEKASHPQSGRLRCGIDKSTLTRTRCEYWDGQGESRQTLLFDQYRSFGDIVWPMHLEGSGEAGSFELVFDRVELNTDLPQRAFSPPRRAVKQP